MNVFQSFLDKLSRNRDQATGDPACATPSGIPFDKGFKLAVAFLLSPFLGGMVILAFLLEHLLRTRLSSRTWRRIFDPGTEPAVGGVGLCGAGSGFQDRFSWVIPFTGMLLIVSVYAYLEISDPSYFTQDDNYIAWLPLLVQGCESVCAGIIPVWNPYQGGGEPVLFSGAQILTYPPIILSYWVAKHGFGNTYLMLEVLALFNLLFAFGGTYWAARQWEANRWLALAAGICYVLSGFLLTLGRCWFDYFDAAAWLPLHLGIVAPNVLRRANWKWAVTAGLIFGISFNAGFVQLWLYSVFCVSFITVCLLLTRTAPARVLPWMIPAGLIGLGLLLPVLWIQYDFTSGLVRDKLDGSHISWELLPAMLLPPRWTSVPPVFFWEAAQTPQFFYAGSVFALACLCMGLRLLRIRVTGKVLGDSVLLISAGLALSYCMGPEGPVPLESWTKDWPFFKNFRWPWRCFGLVNLLVCLAGARYLSATFGRGRRGKGLAVGAALTAVLCMGYSLTDIPMALNYSTTRPYPALPPQIAERVKQDAAHQQRVMLPQPIKNYPLSPLRDPAYSYSLMANLPTHYEVLSFNLYDTIVYYHPFSRRYFDRLAQDPAQGLRRYGVRWLAKLPHMAADPDFVAGLGEPEQVSGVDLWEVPGAVDPMAFLEGEPGRSFPVSFSAQGASISLAGFSSAEPRILILNMLAWPQLYAFAGGKALARSADDWGRLRIEVPPGTEQVEARYCPPWSKGLWAGFGFFVAGLAVVYGLRQRGADVRFCDGT